MTLEAWTLAGPSVPNDELPAGFYKILKGFKGSFNTFNPGNSGVPYTYIVGWNSAVIDDDEPANNLLNFLSDVLGYSYVSGTAPNYSVKRVFPDSLFDWPVFYAVSAEVEGWGVPGENLETLEQVYPTAKVTVQYKPLDFQVLEDSDLSGS